MRRADVEHALQREHAGRADVAEPHVVVGDGHPEGGREQAVVDSPVIAEYAAVRGGSGSGSGGVGK